MFEFQSKTERFKVAAKIQQQYIIRVYTNIDTNTNIYTLLLCFDGNFKKFVLLLNIISALMGNIKGNELQKIGNGLWRRVFGKLTVA